MNGVSAGAGSCRPAPYGFPRRTKNCGFGELIGRPFARMLLSSGFCPVDPRPAELFEVLPVDQFRTDRFVAQPTLGHFQSQVVTLFDPISRF